MFAIQDKVEKKLGMGVERKIAEKVYWYIFFERTHTIV